MQARWGGKWGWQGMGGVGKVKEGWSGGARVCAQVLAEGVHARGRA